MKYKFLILIVLLAGILRFLFIGSLPPSLTWDEVAWGYNAYSLGIDGKDEFGKLLPLTYIESFGDFKPPLYAYLDILPVKILGLNEFATRFPSAFFGTLTVLLTYFFVLELFGKEKKKLALLSSFFLAISPWHIMLSRAAFEANVAHFFVLLGVFLYLKWIHKGSYFLFFGVLSLVLSMYTFNSARIVSPLLFIVITVIFYKRIIPKWKNYLISCLFGLLIFMPLFLFMNTPQAKLRFNEVNIFSDISIINTANREIENDHNSAFSKIIHNRRFQYGVEYIRHYFDNLTPQFLFIRGDGNPKFSLQDVGQLYLWEIPFLIGGAFILFRKREKAWWVIPIMIVVGIIPAGFARETPHALRIENTLPAFQILTAIGVAAFIGALSRKKIAATLLGIIVFCNFFYFIHNYLTHYSNEFSGEWQYGYKESVEYVSSVKDKYAQVYVTGSLGRPYVYYLFYMKYDPIKFRADSDVYREALGFVHVNKFSNINFSDSISKVTDKNALYIATPEEAPEGAKIVKEFKLLNGKIALVAYRL